MTLIVARANEAGVIVASDSRATYMDRSATRRAMPGPASPLDGVLKAIIINHSQCIAFAGDVEVARTAIHDVLQAGLHMAVDDDAILERLLEHHRTNGNAADFIVASTIGKPSLHQIAGGIIAMNLTAVWLGNAAAFAEYQRISLTLREKQAGGDADSPAAQISRVTNAMHQPLEGETSFDDVGDFLIRVGSKQHGLVYLPYAAASFPTFSTNSTEPTPVDMGSTATGAYSYGVLCPVDAGIPLVAVYFPHGCFGVVFSPFRSLEPIIVEAARPEIFISHVERCSGFELSGYVIMGDRVLRLRRHKPGSPIG